MLQVGAVQGAENRSQRGVEFAQPFLDGFAAVRNLNGLDAGVDRRRRMPNLVRQRTLLRREEQQGEYGADYFARHSSSPATKMSFGSFLPIKTRIELFFSLLLQALPRSPPIIMCTPWNTTRRGLPFIQSTPL